MEVNFTGHSFNFNENSCRCTCLNIHELRTPARGTHLVINICVVIINILIVIPESILNVLVLIAYVKNRNLHTSANMLLMALSLSDLCVSVLAQPLWVTKMTLQVFVTFNCYIWAANTILLQGTSGMSLLIISVLSVERFLTLAYPFRFQTMITRFRLKVVISLLSLTLWLFVLGEMFQSTYYIVPMVVGVYIIFSVILIIVIWLWIHRLISRHKRQITNLHLSTSAVRDIKTVMRNTKTSYLLSGSVFLCFSPSFVANVYYLVSALYETESEIIDLYVIPWCHTLLFASSLLNPIILLHRKKDFRNTVKNIICFKNNDSTVVNSEGSTVFTW